MSRLPLGVAALALAIVAVGIGPAGTSARSQVLKRDKDCSDFPSQAAAQSYFDSQSGDPDGLDSDGDGVACETNPCPCGGDGGERSHRRSSGKVRARVARVSDGDTIKVRVRGRTEEVRLIGIDTPEVYFGAECGGPQASASLKRVLHAGDRVTLIRDRSQDNRDRYGRLLRYVERRGRDVGRKQIRRGWAKVYVYQRAFNRLPSYRRAEASARRHARGVWRFCGGEFHTPD